MSPEMDFFVYLTEQYAAYKGVSAADVLRTWDERGITDFIYDMYFMYHQEAIENAFTDIDSLVTAGRPAW